MARYEDNTAFDMHALQTQELPERSASARFTVMPGRSSAQQLSPIVITTCKCAVAALAVVVVVSVLRIFLIAAAFSYSALNTTLSSQLDDARASASELEVQQSIYSSEDRIWSLATEAYGMVYPSDYSDVDLSGVSVAASVETE